MQIGDVVLVKTDTDSDIRWVGVVSYVDGDFVRFSSIYTSIRNGERVMLGCDVENARNPSDLVVIGHVDQSVVEEIEASA